MKTALCTRRCWKHRTKERLPALATIEIRVQGSVPRHEGSKMLVYADKTFVGTVGGGAMESLVMGEAVAALADGQTRRQTYTLNDLAAGDPGICGGTVEVFIEPVATAPTLLVIGGGHVGKALAQLGKWMDYRVILRRPPGILQRRVPAGAGRLCCASRRRSSSRRGLTSKPTWRR